VIGLQDYWRQLSANSSIVACRTANPTSFLRHVVGSASLLSATAIFWRLSIPCLATGTSASLLLGPWTRCFTPSASRTKSSTECVAKGTSSVERSSLAFCWQSLHGASCLSTRRTKTEGTCGVARGGGFDDKNMSASLAAARECCGLQP